MDYNLQEICPQLSRRLDKSQFQLSAHDLQNNQFFKDLVDEIVEWFDHNNHPQQKPNAKNKTASPMIFKDVQQFKEIKQTIVKIMNKAIPIKVPKGTVIYTIGMPPDQGYFLIHGCVELLNKKANWEKLENLENCHFYKPEQRAQFLESKYNINQTNFQIFQNLFFQEKILFNFIGFHKIYSKGYFGFRQTLHGCLRTKTAIAVEESIIVKIKKSDFDKYLRQFQQKREQYVIKNMFSNVKSDIVNQILPKISNIFNSAEIINYDRDQVILKQNEFASGLYFLIDGEVTVSKDVRIQVPKKYLSNENKGQFVKEVKVKLHTMTKHAFIGQIEHLLTRKTRQFTVEANLNNTTLIKFDPNIFMKTIAESSIFERELTVGAKYKYSTTMEAYLNQKNAIVKSYFNQFEELDHKKKQKNVSNLLKNEPNFKQNQLYELFKKQGIFYRDSFERLQGFEEFLSKHDSKRSTIQRHKVQSNLENSNYSSNKKIARKQIQNNISKSPKNQNDIQCEAKQRMLMSPLKTANAFQILNSELQSKLDPVSQQEELKRKPSLSTLRKKTKQFSKFQQLKKDDTIFKRVLIKNGKYDIPRETNKSNMVQAIVNHQFDEIVKECMTRKNAGLRKALFDHREDIIKQQFKKTVSALPNRSLSLTKFGNTSYGYTCKGVDQMRKTLDRFKYQRRSTVSEIQRQTEQYKLQDCIGYNKTPLSSEVKHRSSLMPHTAKATRKSMEKKLNRSPQKIILLNHMMKPITYVSSQL